jgi:hypothetical protein
VARAVDYRSITGTEARIYMTAKTARRGRSDEAGRYGWSCPTAPGGMTGVGADEAGPYGRPAGLRWREYQWLDQF